MGRVGEGGGAGGLEGVTMYEDITTNTSLYLYIHKRYIFVSIYPFILYKVQVGQTVLFLMNLSYVIYKTRGNTVHMYLTYKLLQCLFLFETLYIKCKIKLQYLHY